MNRTLAVAALVAGALASVGVTPAHATFHLWKFDEAFSNADGSRQFIEMFTAAGGQQFFHTDDGGPFGPAQMVSGGQTFVFPHDIALPNVIGHDTDNQHLLLATPGFFPDGLVPDFTIPKNFLPTSNGTVQYEAKGGIVLDAISWTTLPTDGVHSLNQVPGTTTQTIDVASPTNFTGEKGGQVVPVPAAVWVGVVGLAGVVTFQTRGRGKIAWQATANS